MRKKWLFPSVVLICAVSLCCMRVDKKVKYLPLGDSYTICEGATMEESWPVILTKHLNDNGIGTELVGNPARTGWTTQNLIDHELPIFEQMKPDFVTLLIGVNDWVQGIDSDTFHKNLNFILDKVDGQLANKKNLVLITIPDFGVTPTGAMYSGGRNITEGIKSFNKIITDEASKRGLACVDIFPTTQQMKDNPDLTARDGLHPSAKEYAKWENLIYPAAYKVLKAK